MAAALVVHAALAWHFRAAALTTGQDDAIYLLLAKALRAGSYRDLWLVEAPVESRYPPGYPAFLAVFAGTGPGMFARGVALNIALSMLGLALAYLVARRWSAPLAALTVVVLAVNPSLVHYAGEVRSEPLFLVLSLLVLVLLARPAPGRGRMVLAGALAILGALTRSIGLVLLPVVLVPWLRARAWRAAGAYALVALLTVGGWLLWTVRAPVKLAGESYVADALLSHPPAPAPRRAPRGGRGAGAGPVPRPRRTRAR
ncbi:MAG: hypothetical protein IPK12_22690 [Gemmatimonadetes bacterium]|nr:hypothetical protein [Gemmatimonadota bacterium]